LTHFGRLKKLALEQAVDLRARGVKVILLYAENDAGRDELARYFGKRDPSAYDHATVRIVPDADHNMTAGHARDAIRQALNDAVPH
jgi:hypothetical protein